MPNIQFIQTTPEQLESSIVEKVKTHLDDLRKYFQPKEPSEYLTRHEVADLLKINISTVHNYTKKGLLLSYGIERRVLYKRKEVENAIVELIK